MARTPEGKVKFLLDKMLKEERVWFFSPQAGPYGRSGIPDRIACVDGHFVGIECKADRTKKPTRLQEFALREIAGAGGTTFVVFCAEGVETVRNWIRAGRMARAVSSSEHDGED